VAGVRLESFVSSSHTEPLTMVWLHDAIDWLGPLKLKLSGLSSSREIIRAAKFDCRVDFRLKP
jgi:hypothetical protein